MNAPVLCMFLELKLDFLQYDYQSRKQEKA